MPLDCRVIARGRPRCPSGCGRPAFRGGAACLADGGTWAPQCLARGGSDPMFQGAAASAAARSRMRMGSRASAAPVASSLRTAVRAPPLRCSTHRSDRPGIHSLADPVASGTPVGTRTPNLLIRSVSQLVHNQWIIFRYLLRIEGICHPFWTPFSGLRGRLAPTRKTGCHHLSPRRQG